MSSDNKKDKSSLENSFLKTRTIVISDQVDNKLANAVIRQTLMLEDENPKLPIKVLINSPGGEISSGFAIFDTLKFVSCPICTIVTGLAASMGSVLALAADKGLALAMPNARVMIHQPLLTGARGSISDLEIHAKEIVKMRDSIISIYSAKTGKTRATVKKDIERDNWLSSEEARKYGLVDKIITSRAELGKLLT